MTGEIQSFHLIQLKQGINLKTTSELILQNLIQNEEYHKKVIPFLKSEYFENQGEQVFFRHVSEYSGKYNRVPTIEALFIEIGNDKKVTESQATELDQLITVLKKKDSEKVDDEWLLEKTEEFCRDRAINNAIMDSISIIDGDNKKLGKGAIPDLLKDALSVGFDTTLGHDIFDNAEDRWNYYHRRQERIPFNLEYFNKVTRGGFSKKTLNLFIAGTHVGKTAIMIHHAASNLADGKNVVYFSMEMAEEEISKRIDANLMGLEINDVETMSKDLFLKKVNQLKAKNPGKLIVKEFPTGQANVNHFRHFINELKLKKNITPDIIYVDYLNICSSYRLTGNASANSYSILKAVSEELRGLAMELNVCIVSASQFNRGSANSSDPEMDGISDSFGIAFTADSIFALIATDELKEQGKIMVKQLKNRYADMNLIPSFFLSFNRGKQKFYDADDVTPQSTGVNVVETNKFFDKSFKANPSFNDFKL